MIEKDFGERTRNVTCAGQIRKILNTSCCGALSSYTEIRRKIERLQQPYIEDEEDIIGKYLFETTYIEETKKEIHKFWIVREKRRENEEQRPRQ